MMAFAAGCLLGLSGSAHCAAMCGPLWLSVRASGGDQRVRSLCAYHSGRLLVYVLLAMPAAGLARAVQAGGLGSALAVVAGIVLVGVAAGVPLPGPLVRIQRTWSRQVARCGAACRPTARGGFGAALHAGVINGLLPCGLVYPAVLAASAAGGPWHTLLFMVGFGAGTSPAAVVIGLAAARLPPRLRARAVRLGPLVLALTGAILIARGLFILDALPHLHAGLHQH